MRPFAEVRRVGGFRVIAAVRRLVLNYRNPNYMKAGSPWVFSESWSASKLFMLLGTGGG